jgi:hypothetical protein
MMEPPDVVLSKLEVTPVIAKVVEVELTRSELPRSVVEPRRLEATELKAPEMVEEPEAKSVPKVAPPTALSCPAMVEDDVTERRLVVAEMVLIPVNCEVEDAWIPLVKLMIVEVELTPTPKLLPGVNGKPKIFDDVR